MIIVMASLERSKTHERGKDDLLEVCDLLPESVQVEIVSDIVLVDLGKEFVAFQVAKPLDPAIAAFTIVFVVHRVSFVSF